MVLPCQAIFMTIAAGVKVVEAKAICLTQVVTEVAVETKTPNKRIISPAKSAGSDLRSVALHASRIYRRYVPKAISAVILKGKA